MTKHSTSMKTNIGAMAGVILAMGGAVLQPIRHTVNTRNPNSSAAKLAKAKAEAKRERKRLANRSRS